MQLLVYFISLRTKIKCTKNKIYTAQHDAAVWYYRRWFILRPTVSRPVRLGIGLPFGAHDQILSLSFLYWQLLCCFSCRAPPLTRGRVYNLQRNCRLVRSLRTNNRTLPSHLRLCALFVASYDSQVLRWRYSNPPPHGRHDITTCTALVCRSTPTDRPVFSHVTFITNRG
jgi:hypothetical protein